MRLLSIFAFVVLLLLSETVAAESVTMVWTGTCERPNHDPASVNLTLHFAVPDYSVTGTLNGLTLANIGWQNAPSRIIVFDTPGIFQNHEVERHFSGIHDDSGNHIVGSLKQDAPEKDARCDLRK
jgi:hypothetical protein